MNIENGGQLQNFSDTKLKELVVKTDGAPPRCASLWINRDSVSYLTIKELLDLKDEIQDVLNELVR